MPTAKDLDKFYTKPETARRLFDVYCDVLVRPASRLFFLEPSAGSGSFSRLFTEGSPDKLADGIAYDLLPEADGIKQADFLELPTEWNPSTVAIGNPPFGYKGKLATDFLNKCLDTCSAVGFVLPSTFKRYSVQSKISPGARLVYEEKLPLDSFTFEGDDFSLNCIFQVWIPATSPLCIDCPDMRIISKPPISHPDIEIWQHNATEQSRKYLDYDWDYAFYRQGFRCVTDFHCFTKDKDYEQVKDIVYNTNLQIFYVKIVNERARGIILDKMDLVSLAQENLAQPGFGKADFVRAYTECLTQCEADDASDVVEPCDM